MGTGEIADGSIAAADLNLASVTAALNGTYGRLTQTAAGNRTVYLGDSITLGGTDNPNNNLGASYPLWASMFSQGKALMVRNAGVAGDTTAQMLARFDTDVTPYAPSNVVILGGTNDVKTGVPFATFKANIKAMVAKCYAIGAKPVLGTVPPNNTAGNHPAISLWNHWVKRYGASINAPVIDFYSTLVDTATGNYNSTYDGGDGTHPNVAGYRVMGSLASTVLSPILPTANVPLIADNADVTSTLVTSNGLLVTDTNADGVPDGWIAYGGASGFAHALVTDALVPGKMEQITMTAAASVRIFERTISTGFSVGDVILFAVVVTSDGGVRADAKLNFTSASRSAFACQITGVITRGIAYYEVPVPTGTTAVVIDLIANAGTGVVAFGQPTLINLTTGGILTP